MSIWLVLEQWEAWARSGGSFSWESDAVALLWQYDHIYVAAAIAYIPVVFGLQAYMADRPPLSLKPLLIMWNFVLAIFSIVAAVQLIPILLMLLLRDGFLNSVCETAHYDLPSSWWVYLFGLSKIAEFVDTILLALRKKPIILLHWYHHICTHLFTWLWQVTTYKTNGSGYWFATMNVAVHSFMYTYYGLTAMGHYRTMAKLKLNMVLTLTQLTQMVMGIVVLFAMRSCPSVQPWSFYIGLGMYFSYFLLFAKLFLDKYISPPPKRSLRRASQETQDPIVLAASPTSPIARIKTD
ncbi:uncharacterized protein AMSG_06337 [Thecamonas trahens ATCC 50062]|uniref:Elongation of fatty acids protein n=1 Tax=Thecamonas trahens ATCC 50062 TaxID=461836 RepID=A0A0L0DCX7_THETB|nr:hypothetical protein AMSG_06337 [Thecamonas trahens ATCC 50062]KNC50192.1 hypothetical protein AMSG_06337 [Thecamonas trahens ATCC 50062]|eukprot:XP_013757029.1 hypothetical protein AMSG_06337 [Thecamonas trahens ATCC 50062]